MKSLKKVFFVGIVFVIIGAFLYAYFILGNQLRSSRGLSQGGKYVTKMYSDYSVAGSNCQGEDTDKNGYITCNFRLKQVTSGVEKSIVLQCPTFIKSFMATSCKEQGILINSQ